jgi:hypothetical protein
MPLSRATQQVLADCLAGGEARAGAAVARAPATFGKLRDRLSRVIGGMGFTALLRRSIAIAKSDDAVTAHLDDQALFNEAALAAIDATKGDQFVLTVVATLVSLLAAFIGKQLSGKILREVWPQLATVAIEFAGADDEESST